MNTHTVRRRHQAFTIIELVVIIVVIGILATISLFAMRQWQDSAAETRLKNDLVSVKGAMDNARNWSKGGESGYPLLATGAVFNGENSATKKLFTQSPDVTLLYYSGDRGYYCVDATSNTRKNIFYFLDSRKGEPKEGTCAGGEGSTPIANGSVIQAITSSSCPAQRTMAVDARDNRTYWVQKLSDGRCWMLTNLGYSGAGVNTYGDTKNLQNGSSDTSNTYTSPKYYALSGANVTASPSEPNSSTSGIGQYGYLYNWCAAMGGQSTAACSNASTPTPDTNISLCPAGWRLPNSGEFGALNSAVNDGSTYSDNGLRTQWLAQYGGYWNNGSSIGRSSDGYYWSSTQDSASNSRVLRFTSGIIYLSIGAGKEFGRAVRCIAS